MLFVFLCFVVFFLLWLSKLLKLLCNMLLKIILLINFWLRRIFIAARGLSLVAESRSCSLVAVHRLLTAISSLVVDHRV